MCWWPWCTISPPTAGRSPRWSRDLGVAYASRCAGRAPGWAPLPVQYVDYTLWQRAQLGDLDDSRQPDRRAAGLLAAGAGRDARACCSCPPIGPIRRWPITAAPVWRWTGRRSCSSGCAGGRASTTRPASWWCRPPWRCCCRKISASSDVAVGFPIAGRGDPALDELVGFFVNTLVLRVDVAGDPTVAELLAQVRQRSLAAYEHQDVPFEVLVERLNPTRSPDPSPAGSGDVGLAELPGQDPRRAGLG